MDKCLGATSMGFNRFEPFYFSVWFGLDLIAPQKKLCSVRLFSHFISVLTSVSHIKKERRRVQLKYYMSATEILHEYR